MNSAIQLQADLSKTLNELMRLNPQATQLRVQRTNADRAWYSAISSGNPYAIAAARAVRTAVILAQTALQAQQQRLLVTAGLQRLDHHRRLQSAGKTLAKTPVKSQSFYVRALAVKPVPSASPTPDYVPVSQFAQSQQHQFSFDLELSPPLWRMTFVQKTLCSVSLKGKEGAWKPKIIAANAFSKWP